MRWRNSRWATDPQRPLTLPSAFDRVYLQNEWGKGSGQGSDPLAAAPYVELLGKFLREHQIRSVLDCGCGDGRIAASVDWGSASYHGIDASRRALALAVTRLPEAKLEQTTIAAEDRVYDLAIVKEVFQHLPFEEIARSLYALRGCKHLLVINDVPGDPALPGPEQDIPFGAYRPLDIREAPLHAGPANVLLEYRIERTLKRVLHLEMGITLPAGRT
jgi:SAM-dependent methyltransferase